MLLSGRVQVHETRSCLMSLYRVALLTIEASKSSNKAGTEEAILPNPKFKVSPCCILILRPNIGSACLAIYRRRSELLS
jgi:hypothetical protein